MIGVQIEVRGLQQALERVKGLAQRVRAAARAELERRTIQLQAHVVQDKLSGQVLRNRTGTLRRSIYYRVEDAGDVLRGVVGTNLRYAPIHEYGGTIMVPEIVPVRARALHFSIGGREVFARRARAHIVRMPMRSFLRSALADLKPEIVAGVRLAVARAVRAA